VSLADPGGRPESVAVDHRSPDCQESACLRRLRRLRGAAVHTGGAGLAAVLRGSWRQHRLATRRGRGARHRRRWQRDRRPPGVLVRLEPVHARVQSPRYFEEEPAAW